MKKTILFASISVASGLLFVNLYTSIVDAQSWGGDMPHSIATAREYFQATNPGNFFRLFSPINQLLGLLVLILFWKSSRAIRLFLFAALGFYILGDVFTFAYFYPRNEIMFETAQLSDVNLLSKTWLEWSRMNWIRSLVILTGLTFSFLSLNKIDSQYKKEKSYADPSLV